jgi:diketogulonate reductase-like aldo/keto reductase
MHAKAEQRANESTYKDADHTDRKHAPGGSAGVDDLRPETVAQRQNSDIANAGPRMDHQRMAASAIQRKTNEPASNRTGLPDQLRAGIESLSGISMDGVMVHYNSSQPAQLNALAYAQGTDIHIAPGQETHLPHEAWHVVQQAQGRVGPTTQMNDGVPVNDDPGLEHEADVMGGRASETGKNKAVTQQREEKNATDILKPISFSFSRGTPTQHKLIVRSRTIHKNSLFDGSAFKKRLTAKMDAYTEQYDLSRDDVRKNVIEMIDSDLVHTFDSTAELMAMASDNAHIDKKMILRADDGNGDDDGEVKDDADGNVEHVDEDIEDKGNGENWLVFGMDGKSKLQVQHALRIGYRNFDCAQSYGTTETLARMIPESGIERGEIKITYKFNLVNGEAVPVLKARLAAVVSLFDGYVDILLIHNLDADGASIKAAWTVMQEMKKENLTNSVGVGNVNEGHARLLEELQETGDINIVENSLSSVLGSPELMNMIKGTDADLMFYDVVRTAAEIGISSPDGIKAIMSTVETQMAGDTREGEKRTHMIMSSGNLDRNIDNFKNFGDGADREYDWTDQERNEKIDMIVRWQKDQNVIQGDDPNFALAQEVKDPLLAIVTDNAAAMRTSITTAAGGADQVTPQHVRAWLNGHTTLSNEVMDSVRVPARPGLKKRYFNMTLGEVLEGLFGPKNCDWKWTIQLVQLMSAENEAWNLYLKYASDEIVAE